MIRSPGNIRFGSGEDVVAQSYFCLCLRTWVVVGPLSLGLLSASMETMPRGGWDRGHWVQNLALVHHHIGRALGPENQPIRLQSGDDYRSCLVRGLRRPAEVTPASYPRHVQPPGPKYHPHPRYLLARHAMLQSQRGEGRGPPGTLSNTDSSPWAAGGCWVVRESGNMGLAHLTIEGGWQAGEGQLPGRKGRG